MCSLGASFGLPLGILLANEASSKKQAKVNIALSGVTFAVIPITSIFIGSMIASFLSWNWFFLAGILYSVFLFFLSFKLPLDTKYPPSVKSFFNTIQLIISNFRSPLVVIGGCIWGLFVAQIINFSSSGPILFDKYFDLNLAEFGDIYTLFMIPSIFGALLNLRLTKKGYSSLRLLFIGALFTLSGTFIYWYAYLFDFSSSTVFASACFIVASIPFGKLNGISLGYTAPKDPITASGVISFIGFSIAVLSLFLANLTSNIALYLGSLFLILNIIIFLLIGIAKLKCKKFKI